MALSDVTPLTFQITTDIERYAIQQQSWRTIIRDEWSKRETLQSQNKQKRIVNKHIKKWAARSESNYIVYFFKFFVIRDDYTVYFSHGTHY